MKKSEVQAGVWYWIKSRYLGVRDTAIAKYQEIDYSETSNQNREKTEFAIFSNGSVWRDGTTLEFVTLERRATPEEIAHHKKIIKDKEERLASLPQAC